MIQLLRKYTIGFLVMGGLFASLYFSTQVQTASCFGLESGKPYKHPFHSGVYYISEDCTKRPIKNSNIYFSYFNSWNDVDTVSQSLLDSIPDNELGFLPWGPKRDFKNGSLLKTVTDPKVYLILNDKRYPIGSETAFRNLGYSFAWIEDVDQRVLNKYLVGRDISSTSDYPKTLVFKYEGSPKVYILDDHNDKDLGKRHVISYKDLSRDYRVDRIAVLPSSVVINDSPDGEILEGTSLKDTNKQVEECENYAHDGSCEKDEKESENKSKAICGNGIKETGEYCDDGRLNGQAGECNAQCSAYLPLSSEPSEDSDSGSICGNNIRESGEVCDSGSNNGKVGYCNKSCSGTIPSSSVVLPTLPPVGTPTVQWTKFTPAANTNIIYVSSNGNDKTGKVYSAAEVGNDPFNPSVSIQSFATLAAAMNQARNDMPDWVLLKRGDTFYTDTLVRPRSGQSASAMSLIGSYGSGPRPVIIPTVTDVSVITAPPGLSHAAITDLDIYGEQHDPTSPSFAGYGTMAGGMLMLASTGNTNTNILIENNRFRYLGGAFNFQAFGGTFTNVTIRGNAILHSYGHTGHSGGAYFQEINGLLFEGNIFDHNGWLKQSIQGNNAKEEGQATIFNHNLYLNAVHNTTLRNNAFLRASSIGAKVLSESATQSSNVVFEDNLFVEGEVGISFGGNDKTALQKYDTVSVRDNVFMHIGRARPTNRHLSWAITLEALFGGPNVIDGNIFMLQEESNLSGNAFAIQATLANEQTSITNNIVYDYYSDSGTMTLYNNAGNSQITFANNEVQSPGYSSVLMNYEAGPYTYSGNKYYSTAPTSGWFVDKSKGNGVDQSMWSTLSGESNPQFSQASYPNPNVRLESYVSSQGKGSTYSDFINVMRAQERASWNANFEPSVINDYIRAGFGR